jgi:hypothetical protein
MIESRFFIQHTISEMSLSEIDILLELRKLDPEVDYLCLCKKDTDNKVVLNNALNDIIEANLKLSNRMKKIYHYLKKYFGNGCFEYNSVVNSIMTTDSKKKSQKNNLAYTPLLLHIYIKPGYYVSVFNYLDRHRFDNLLELLQFVDGVFLELKVISELQCAKLTMEDLPDVKDD